MFAVLPACALAARGTLDSDRGRLQTYVDARTADAIGDPHRASELFSALFAADRSDTAIGRRAVDAGIEAGDFDRAIAAALGLPPARRTLAARLLLVANELRRGRVDAALTYVGSNDADGAFVQPLLRAWAERAAHRDGDAVLSAPEAASTLLAPYLPEQRAFILLASRRAAEATPLIKLALANAGGREDRLRFAFADGLRRNGDGAGAAALLVGAPPPLQRYATAKAARGIAIDNAASAFAEMLLALSISVGQSEDQSLPISLAQTAHLAAPANSEGSVILALMLRRADRKDEALALLDGVPANDPLASDARDAAVELLGKAGRTAEAIQRARAAIGRDSTADDFARLGGALDRSGDHAAAADAYAQAVAAADRAGSNRRASYRLLRADQLDKIGRWPEAKIDLLAALAIAPENALTLNFLGYGELERGENVAAAEAMIRKASALDPEDASITDSLGWALYKRGRLPEAIETLRLASAGDPGQAEINEHLGDALFSSGRRIEARFAWRAALVTADTKDKGRIETKLERGLTPVTVTP